MSAAAQRRLRRAATALRWRVGAPVWARVYRAVVGHLSWWSREWLRARPARGAARGSRSAYYLWTFPVLSETFIQREVAHLIAAAVRLELIAHSSAPVESLGDAAKALMARTYYLRPLEQVNVAPYAWRFLRQQPLRVAGLFVAVVACRYEGRKAFGRDVYLFKRALYLAHVLREKGIAHVHTPWATQDAFVALIAARLLQIRYTVGARASDIHRTSQACNLPTKLLGADRVITNSQYNERVLRALLGERADGRLRRMYGGVEVDRLRPSAAGRRGGDAVRILCVARLIEAKGIEYLIRACRMLKDRGYCIRCEIVGGRQATSVNYYITLQRLRRALALEADVTFLGAEPFERVVERYQSADVFVLPSVIAADGTGDVTPNVLMEAMAMQLPVVSTRSRAIPEIVEDGVSGILVPPRDATALADAIMRVMQDRELRVTLSRNARRRVEERFDISKNVRELLVLFEGLE